LNDAATDLRSRILALLARREHSAAEIANKLAARGFAREAVSKVLIRLQEEQLLSDSRFTEGYVEQRIARGCGPRRIRQELCMRGISDALIEEYLHRDPQEWLAAAMQARRKRFGDQLPSHRAEWIHQARFLQYKGFTREQIQEVLRR
jgi:regulatory protein